MHALSLQHLTGYFAHYGYWTVLIGLLLENAGIPLPGETILLIASSTAATSPHLHIAWVALIGIFAASLGDNIGYWIGRSGGRAFLNRYGRVFHVQPATLLRGEALIQKHGAPAIFTARFIAGLRIIAGVMAGALQMEWPRFFIFNLLGAISWVSVICTLGFLFGNRLPWLIHLLGTTGMVLLAVGIAAAAVMWWFLRRSTPQPAR